MKEVCEMPVFSVSVVKVKIIGIIMHGTVKY